MATALDKALAQHAEETKGSPQQARAALITRLKALPQDQIVKVVESLSLPSSTGKWTLEQLREVVTTCEGKPVSAAPPNTDRRFVLQYNESDNTLVSVTEGMTDEEWEAFQPEDGVSAVMVGSPDDLGEVPTDVLLAVFNAGKGTKAKKFADPSTAREQAFNSMAAIVDGAADKAEGAAKKAKTPKTPREPAAPKVINKEPKAKDQIKQVGAGTKIATLIDLLAQEEGTTVAEIEEKLSASGKPVKAAAWLGYDLNTVAGYGVRQDGDRLYLVLPKGMTAPLAHKTREAKAPAAPAAPAAETPAAAPAASAKKGGAKKGGAAPAAVATEETPAAPAAPAKRGLPPALAKANAERAAAKKAAEEAAKKATPAKKAAPAAPAKKGGKK